MSVRAYLVHEDVKMIDDKRYVHEDHEYLWNNWSESEIWEILWNICIDMTNDDCIGTMEIWVDAWEDLKEDYKYQNSDYGKEIHKVVDKYKNVFQRIDTEFKKGNDYVKIVLY